MMMMMIMIIYDFSDDANLDDEGFTDRNGYCGNVHTSSSINSQLVTILMYKIHHVRCIYDPCNIYAPDSRYMN